jgi:predicted NUDIX family NTP pyrophosphohydrolase
MGVVSAGLLMCRFRNTGSDVEFFLVHPGGPFYARKDAGVWSIPKGLPENDEALEDAARREFEEETGIVPRGPFHSLGTAKLKSGKTIHAWAFLGAWNPEDGIVSNTFELEWPPRSGKRIMVPENDRAGWFTFDAAVKLIKEQQVPFLERARTLFQKS